MVKRVSISHDGMPVELLFFENGTVAAKTSWDYGHTQYLWPDRLDQPWAWFTNREEAISRLVKRAVRWERAYQKEAAKHSSAIDSLVRHFEERQEVPDDD